MGKYSKEISKRIHNTKITEGYCLICGSFGRLTADHVPPKGSITITKVEQRHITEAMGEQASKIRGVVSRNGSKFKTICAQCNNVHLGHNDDEIARVNAILTQRISHHFKSPFNPTNIVSTPVNAVRYCRATIGHILAATTVKECEEPPVDTTFYTPLKQFVLGDDRAIEDTHDIYYWFYPHLRQISAKTVGFFHEGIISCMGLLSFYPIAFLITEKGKGVYPVQGRKLHLTDSELKLDLSSASFHLADFPFHKLVGNQMMLLDDTQAIVSYPKVD